MSDLTQDDIRVWANETYADSITRDEWIDMGLYKNWIGKIGNDIWLTELQEEGTQHG